MGTDTIISLYQVFEFLYLVSNDIHCSMMKHIKIDMSYHWHPWGRGGVDSDRVLHRPTLISLNRCLPALQAWARFKVDAKRKFIAIF